MAMNKVAIKRHNGRSLAMMQPPFLPLREVALVDSVCVYSGVLSTVVVLRYVVLPRTFQQQKVPSLESRGMVLLFILIMHSIATCDFGCNKQFY